MRSKEFSCIWGGIFTCTKKEYKFNNSEEGEKRCGMTKNVKIAQNYNQGDIIFKLNKLVKYGRRVAGENLKNHSILFTTCKETASCSNEVKRWYAQKFEQRHVTATKPTLPYLGDSKEV